MMSAVPLPLSGGAFAVWSQLPARDRSSILAVRSALFAAFALDQLAAFEAFSDRKLQPGESPDVYLWLQLPPRAAERATGRGPRGVESGDYGGAGPVGLRTTYRRNVQ